MRVSTRHASAGTLFAIALVVGARESAGQDADSVRQLGRYAFLAADYQYQTFFGDITPWQFGSLSAGAHGSDGTIIGRVNGARRFETDGAQGEVDAYPLLGTGRYAYVNVGYAGDSPVFPRWRWGAEYFASLPHAFEASVGARQLRFTQAPVTLFTGSVGKYAGNYWFSARPFLRAGGQSASASLGLTMRRYYADGDHWLGASLGVGSMPNDRITQSELARTSDFSASVAGSGGPWSTTLATWSVGYERERLPSALVRKSLAVDVGVRHRL